MLYDVVGFSKKRPGILSEDLKLLLSYLAEGRLQPVIAARFPLLEARRAQETILNARAQGKVILLAGER